MNMLLRHDVTVDTLNYQIINLTSNEKTFIEV